MPELLIADTSCLILLEKINATYLFNELYDNVIVTHEIAKEFEQELPTWISVQENSNVFLQRSLNMSLGLGESSAIALAALNPDKSLLVLDDLKARKIAKSIGLKLTGSLGVLVKAKDHKHIQNIKPFLEKIQNTNFRINQSLCNALLKHCNEI